jgi:hypothetical protein
LDATGKAAEDAARRNAKELQARAEELSTIRQAEEELLKTAVFDPKNPDAPILLDEIEEVGVNVISDKVVIRTITDIDDMTYGVGNTYSFKSGQKYSVPRDLADYLESLGYIWRPN